MHEKVQKNAPKNAQKTAEKCSKKGTKNCRVMLEKIYDKWRKNVQ